MLVKYQILALLPVIAYGHITISMKVGQDEAEASLDSFGESRNVISKKDRMSFKLDDQSLKAATEKYKGKRCSNVYLRAPTPEGDLYYETEWNEVETILKPTGGKVVSISSQRVNIAKATYLNRHNARYGRYFTKVMKEINETLTHTWSKAKPLTVGDDTIYRVMFGQGNARGITTLLYNSRYGNNNTKSRAVVLGSKVESSVEVPPGEKISEILSVVKGIMKVEVTYVATLMGDVICNYSKKYEGRNKYAFDIKEIQKAGNLPQKIASTEKITIAYYSNVMNIIYNATGNDTLLESEGGIIRVDEIVET